MSWFSKHVFSNIHPAAIGSALVTIAGIVTAPAVLAILPAKASAPLAAVGVVLQMITRSVSNARTLDGAAKIAARQSDAAMTDVPSDPAPGEVTPGVPSVLPPNSMATYTGPKP